MVGVPRNVGFGELGVRNTRRVPEPPSFDSLVVPPGAQILPFENLEGLVLVRATLRGRAASAGAGTELRDTTGLLVLDTGAGYLALDRDLTESFGLLRRGAAGGAVDYARQPLPRLTLGRIAIDQVTPLLAIDGGVVRRVTDRPVLGLLGQRPLTGRAIVVDYRDERLAIVPVPQNRPKSIAASRSVIGPFFSNRARAVTFLLAGDGKIVVAGAVSDPDPPTFSLPLRWIVDTGATRCVLFNDVTPDVVRASDRWPAIQGLIAPTLFGDEQARIASVPVVRMSGSGITLEQRDVETVLIGGPLSRTLSSAVGERIHGLLGYAFLRNYRIGIDYVNHVLWLDPLPEGWENRPYRTSQVGLEVERRGGAIRVSGVVRGSSADEAGIRVDDEVLAVDGVAVATLDVVSVFRRFEGPPGSTLWLTLRRGTRNVTHHLVRRRLF